MTEHVIELSIRWRPPSGESEMPGHAGRADNQIGPTATGRPPPDKVRCSHGGTCRRRWTALARSGYLIRDLANPCQPTAYLCPKAEDGNRRKSVLQRARQRSG